MSEDFEKIDLTLPTSDYALVIFHNAQETYHTESDIECGYTVTPALVPSNKDWVGVYKVGWRSAREYTCFDWSVIPENYESGSRAEVSITFKAQNLPKDDGEFYQFCYVTSAGHVRGASTPFQFRSPGASEYVEVEDDEDEDILVIKTKTAMLEDELTKAEREKEELSKTIEYLENEKESLLGKLISTEKILQQERDQSSAFEEDLQEAKLKLESNREEKEELLLLHGSLKEKVSVLNQEKESWMKRLDDNDAYIKSLQEKIKTLINDKDALTGQNKTLEEEKELFKTHFTSSEGQVKGYLVELEELRKKLRQEEQVSKNLRDEVASLAAEVHTERQRVESRVQKSDNDKVVLAELEEKLKNSEDKLEATEHCKALLHTEVTTLKQTFAKLSLDLEQSMSETHSYKTKLSKQKDLTQTYVEKTKALQGALDSKDQELVACQEECVRIRQMMEEQQQHQKVEEQGSLFALKVAYNNLSERFEKTRTGRDDARKDLDEVLQKLRKLEREKQEVEEDCRRRLKIGQEEYEKRVVECRRLHTELRRAQRTNSRGTGKEKEILQRQSSTSSAKLQAESSESQTSAKTAQSSDSTPDVSAAAAAAGHHDNFEELTEIVVSENITLMEMTTSELQGQLANLGEELENRQKKKLKYKNLYLEEKEKRAYLQQHYFSELKKKDEEIIRLQNQLQDVNDDVTQRVTTFEALLEQQKVEIEMERRHRPSAPVQVYPPQSQYPMPPFLAPAPAPQPPHFYPPQMPTVPLGYPRPLGPQIPPCHGPMFVHPLPTNVPPVPPRTRDQPPSSTRPNPPPIPKREQELPEQPTQRDLSHPQGLTVDGPDPMDDDTPTNLEPPLQPLPPPMSPRRSIDAMVAEVKAINEGASPQSSQTDLKETTIDMGEGPLEEEEDEDRFHDAEEGPTQATDHQTRQLPFPGPLNSLADLSLRTCPICDMIFPPEVLERDLHSHVEMHMGKTCPVCSQTFDENSPQDRYEEHVQSHFTGNE